MYKQILLFDFDGVIVNTFETCLNISKNFHPSLTADDYRKWFEGNIYDRPKRPNSKESDDNKFFKIYNSAILELTPIENIEKVLKVLSQKYILVIVSSTINSPIKEYLGKYNLLKYFGKVFGADIHKSKVEKIKMVFSKYAITAKDCLFITDTLGDIIEAKKTEVSALGVSWGYHPSETLQRGSPVAIVLKPTDIISEVEQFFSKK